ncbi:asparagine synthase (glutamine-hydrolyzing) [Roseisolibacter agri]|uniref:asparagine synthase (glutamine-hydrolyzing) n=1 Tax=Roseisolibacter agri TaxID=2014610 RepID=A0AA37QKH5_9BACT|nr:asparagine synthase (glutamine-hydrolyzing) [Roseisolibacter agri]GLC27473.1 asparagine synthetase B [Roseisolibacter agri]
MCGIAGLLAVRGEAASADAVRAMADAVEHRGPDDFGTWCDPEAGVALGHRRLSILDLSAEGHQPKVSASGRWMVAFNGEIYNFRALRAELEGRGARFAGHSDTEVLLAGFDAWGLPETIRRAAGMFALAAWDREGRRLHLVRDRLGEKPLYYGEMGGTLLFGSELKALRRHPAWQGEVDRDALTAFLRTGYVPGPYSIYTGIRKVEPGTIVTLRREEGRIVEERAAYWTVGDAFRRGATDPVEGDGATVVDGLDAVLRQAVRDEMVADVPLGAFLSGGIDSSTIVALMQAQSSRPVRTFTIGFHERAFDEAVYARDVARHLGTDHTELYVTPDDLLGVVPTLPALYDEPFADSSQVPTFLVSRLARQHVTVALSGDGGDELFAGYNRYFWGRRVWGAARLVPHGLRRAAANGVRAVSPARWDSVAGAMVKLLPRRYRYMGPGPGDRLHKMAGILHARSGDEMYHGLASIWHEPEAAVLGGRERDARLARMTGADVPPDFVSRMMYTDLLTYLPDDILVKVDRAAMAVSLETRAPFLDHRVVEYALRVPLHHKIRGNAGKQVVKELLYRYVPRSLVDRPKMGFGIPLDQWLRGPLRAWAQDMLAADRLRADGFFEVDLVQRRLREHLSGARNWQHALWCVLMFQAWLAAEREGAR